MNKTDIANIGLLLLGANRITSMDEESTEARIAQSFYPSAHDWVLRAYPWNCVTARAELAEEEEKPLNEYTYKYKLPSECIRVFEVWNHKNIEFIRKPTRLWSVEGRSLLYDHKPCIIVYSRNDLSEVHYDNHVQRVIAYQLALDMSFAITQSSRVLGDMKVLRDEVLYEAKTTDALERSRQRISTDSLQLVRY